MRRGYIARKTLEALSTLLFVLLFNFVLFRVMPGNPADLIARGERLTPVQRVELIEELHLNDSILAQLPSYLSATVRGDLGISYTSGLSVRDTLSAALWPTVLLVGSATFLAIFVGVWVGIISGWRQGTAADKGLLGTSLLFYSVPEGWLAMVLLLVFGSTLELFPLGGYQSPTQMEGAAHIADVLSHLTLPMLTLALTYFGEYAIVMRSSLIDVLGEDYLTTVRAKGLPDRLVRRRHAVPNALLPIATMIFYSIGYVVGGAIIVEAIFGWPGLGRLTYQAIDQQDYPLLQGIFLIASAAVIIVNLIADLTYGRLDPRVREA